MRLDELEGLLSFMRDKGCKDSTEVKICINDIDTSSIDEIIKVSTLGLFSQFVDMVYIKCEL